jgi:inosine-uridine nucleoside N-ribohydrolase
VCLGPLSNIAAFIARDGTSPLEALSQLIVVGGAFFGPGNVRSPDPAEPVAEYNFYVDARAADLVLSSGRVDLVVGMDAARQVPRSALPTHVVTPAAASNASRIALAVLNEARGIDLLYDPLAAALVVDESILTMSVGAAVRVDADPTSPRYGVSRRVGDGRTRVATGIDVERFGAVFASLTGAST